MRDPGLLEAYTVPATLPDPVRDWPLWWFARLEAAIERGDYRTAARAQRELERLVVQRYGDRFRCR
jgi:hypothetical protein